MDALRIVHDLSQIFFSFATPGIAFYGVQSWRSQMRGREQYRIALTIITGAHQIFDEIENCRRPVISSAEWEERQPIQGESKKQEQIECKYFAYCKRYESVSKKLDEWLSVKIEARAYFNEVELEYIERLQACCTRLRNAIFLYRKDSLEGKFDTATEQAQNTVIDLSRQAKHQNDIKSTDPRIIEALKAPDDGGFAEDLSSAVTKIEQHFFQYIKGPERFWGHAFNPFAKTFK